MDIETSKRMIGDTLHKVAQELKDGVAKVDMIPTLYFCQGLRDSLVEDHGLTEADARDIIGFIKVDLSGLGSDATPHMDWLDALARDSATCVAYMWRYCRAEFGRATALKLMQSFKVVELQ